MKTKKPVVDLLSEKDKAIKNVALMLSRQTDSFCLAYEAAMRMSLEEKKLLPKRRFQRAG